MSGPPIGLLAVGQSPREDIEQTFRALLGDGIAFVQAGALDGLTASEIADLAPRVGETPLETRIANGKSAIVAKERMTDLLVAAAERLRGCPATLLLCSGIFPGLTGHIPSVVTPKPIVAAVVRAVAAGRVLGVIGPESDVPLMPASWGRSARELRTSAASPYGPDTDIVSAARAVADAGAEVILLDCMGFSERHRALAAGSVARPVICVTTLIGRLIPELLATGPGST